MGEHVNLEKPELRRQCLAERRRLSSDQIASTSRAICDRVVRMRLFARAQHLVAYAALADEIDPRGIVAVGLERAKTLYFPRVDGAKIEFLSHHPAQLRSGSYGVLEPGGGAPLADGSDVMFLVPGVAFDPGGTRLGRGGGHYDRGLACYPIGFRLGLAAEMQVRKGIARDAWDQPMDAVVTERRLLWTAARRRDCTSARIEETLR